MTRARTMTTLVALGVAISPALPGPGGSASGPRGAVSAQEPTVEAARDTASGEVAAGASVDSAAERPFVEGGVYDRPYLGRLLGRTAVGGYGEAHARYERADGVTEELGFVAKRFNLFTATQVSDFVRIGAELEFEEGAEEIFLEYAAIDLVVHPALTLRGGMILSPLGRFNLSHDSPLNPFTDRPLVSTELLGVALSEPGFGVLGSIGLGGLGRATYEAYATNGFHDGVITTRAEGTRIEAGRHNMEDNNASPAVVGRVAYSPALGHELGVSAHHGAYNLFRADGEAVEARRDLTIAVVDFESALAGVEVRGEGAVVSVDLAPGLTRVLATSQRGLYVEAEREVARGLLPTMPGSSLSVKGRVDAVDFDTDIRGDGVARVSLGVNFRPTADTVVKLDYVRGRESDRFNSRAETAGLLLSLATYF